jgi:nitric oxide dioxygenase
MLENIYVTRPATWLHAAQNGAVHAYRERLRDIAAVRAGELQRRVWYDAPNPEDGVPGDNETSPNLFNLARYHYEGRMDLTTDNVSNDPALHLDNDSAQYLMCGPAGFMNAQRESLMSLGVAEDRIHWEGF